jgi:hypothetical protein
LPSISKHTGFMVSRRRPLRTVVLAEASLRC